MVVTVIRIIERIRTKRWGVDDSFAGLATAMLLVFVVGMFVHLGDPSKYYFPLITPFRVAKPLQQTRPERLPSHFRMSSPSYSTVYYGALIRTVFAFAEELTRISRQVHSPVDFVLYCAHNTRLHHAAYPVRLGCRILRVLGHPFLPGILGV